jgi:hypothetical protein
VRPIRCRLAKPSLCEEDHGEYEVQWRVNYDEHGGAVAELNVLGKGPKWDQIAREP